MHLYMLSTTYCYIALTIAVSFCWLVLITNQANQDTLTSTSLFPVGKITANISQTIHSSSEGGKSVEEMSLWMSLPVTVLIFVILCFLNVVRIIFHKRNSHIQEQKIRKVKLRGQIRAIYQVLQQLIKKVEKNEFPKRRQHKSRRHKVRPAMLRRRISLRMKRNRSMRKKLKQKIGCFSPLPFNAYHVVDEKVTSQRGTVEDFQTVSYSTESPEVVDLSSQFSDKITDLSCSFRYSEESSSLSCDISREATPRANYDFTNICADHQVTSAFDDDGSGDHARRKAENLTESFQDKNLLGLVRLELGVVTQRDSGYQGQEYADSSSDGCWSPAKLRSGNSTTRTRIGAAFTAAHEISSACVTETEAPASKVQNLVNAVEGLNAEKDAALTQLLQNAQTQMMFEMNHVKNAFQLPEEKHEFTIDDVYSCVELQCRRALSYKITSQMKRIEEQVHQRVKACKKLTRHEPKPKKVDKERQFEIALAWEYKHYDRFNETRKNIITRVKSAMEMHWNYAAKKNKKSFVEAPSDEVSCYECASGKHKQYVIVGLKDAIESTDCAFLSKFYGFDESCPLVALVNSWCDKLLENCRTNREKADKLEDLLRRVLKEFYSKRYLERGQLISQVYRSSPTY